MDRLTDLLTSIMKRLDLLESNKGASRMVLPTAASAPSSPIQGEIYFDTGTNKARVYNGTTWSDLW